MSKRTRKLLASDIVMLDPLECGSTVGYNIVRSRHDMSGEVDLADCSRKIQWYFDDEASSIAKIDRVIKLMKDFRAAFVKARASTGRNAARHWVENMQPNDMLAWYVFGPECGRHSVVVQYLMDMGETDTCQILLESKLCIVVPRKLLQHFTVITDAK